MHGSGGHGRACGGDGNDEKKKPTRYDSSVNKKRNCTQGRNNHCADVPSTAGAWTATRRDIYTVAVDHRAPAGRMHGGGSIRSDPLETRGPHSARGNKKEIAPIPLARSSGVSLMRSSPPVRRSPHC